MSYKVFETGVLVIGGGGGARAAIGVSQTGCDVILVDKGIAGKSGITALSFGIVCSYIVPPDSAEVLFSDMVKAGEYLNNQRLLKAYTEEIAAGEILGLEGKYGFVFDRREDGSLVRKKMGGHSYPRDLVVTWNDAPCMMKGAYGEVVKRGIKIINDIMIVSLLTNNGVCVGALGLDLRTGDKIVFKANCTVLATGGLANLYKINDCSRGSTGDGYALAYRAGAELMDMEFVQTMLGFAWPKALEGIGIGEPALVDGKLYNSKNERFMAKIDPAKMDNQPKDIVGRAVMREIKEGRGSEHNAVWMDMTHLNEKYPHYFYLKPLAANVGLDINKEWVEVIPAVHHSMGGVKVNENQESSIPGLFAVAEVATGLHGAERLAGCAVADVIAFAHRGGKIAGEKARRLDRPRIDWDGVRTECERIDNLTKARAVKERIRPIQIMRKIQSIMWQYVHMLRNEKGLTGALQELKEIRESLPRVSVAEDTTRWNPEIIDILEVDFGIEVVEMVTRAALMRKETRGAHEREDFPEKDEENWLKNIVIKLEKGQMILTSVPPVMTKLKRGE